MIVHTKGGNIMNEVMRNFSTTLAENFRDSRITLDKHGIKNDALAAFYAAKASLSTATAVDMSNEKLAQICIRTGLANNEDITAYLSSIVWNTSYVIASMTCPDEKEEVLIQQLAAEYPLVKDNIHNVISKAKISNCPNPDIEDLINNQDLHEYKTEIENETNIYYDNAIALPQYSPDTAGGLYSADIIEDLISKKESRVLETTINNTDNACSENESNPTAPTKEAENIRDSIVKENIKKKNAIAADLLAMFLGVLGLHDFYLGRIACGVTKIILYAISYMMAFNLNGFSFLIGFTIDIWILVDMIKISSNNWNSNKYELEDGRPWTYVILVLKILAIVISYIGAFAIF